MQKRQQHRPAQIAATDAESWETLQNLLPPTAGDGEADGAGAAARRPPPGTPVPFRLELEHRDGPPVLEAFSTERATT